MNHPLARRALGITWSAPRWLLNRTRRFLLRSDYAPLTVGAIITLILWQGTFWDAVIALLWGGLVGMVLDIARDPFCTRKEPRPPPVATPPGPPNQQLTLALAVPAATTFSSPEPVTTPVAVTEPWPVPEDGLSWLNMQWIAGTICRTPSFLNLGGGGARLALCVATQDCTQNPSSVGTLIRTQMHWVVLWGDLAKRYRRKVEKDIDVITVGTSRSRTWKDKQGIERVATELHAKMLWIAEPWDALEDDVENDPPPPRKPKLRPPARPLYQRPKVDAERPAKRRAEPKRDAPPSATNNTRNPR